MTASVQENNNYAIRNQNMENRYDSQGSRKQIKTHRLSTLKCSYLTACAIRNKVKVASYELNVSNVSKVVLAN